jgi:hypothetical protein
MVAFLPICRHSRSGYVHARPSPSRSSYGFCPHADPGNDAEAKADTKPDPRAGARAEGCDGMTDKGTSLASFTASDVSGMHHVLGMGSESWS